MRNDLKKLQEIYEQLPQQQVVQADNFLNKFKKEVNRLRDSIKTICVGVKSPAGTIGIPPYQTEILGSIMLSRSDIQSVTKIKNKITEDYPFAIRIYTGMVYNMFYSTKEDMEADFEDIQGQIFLTNL